MEKRSKKTTSPEGQTRVEVIGTYILITVLFALIGYVVIKFFMMDNVAPFVSEYDGQDYSVRKVGSPKIRQTAADYLAKIKHKVDVLVDYMYRKGLPDPEIASRLFKRWVSCELKETSSTEKSAAFTLNKSTEIRLCIRDKHGNFEDPNTAIFVILHELAHVMSISFGHGEEFKNNFDYITHLASQLGIYKPENFRAFPKTYCGTEINTTPCDRGTCEFATKSKELKDYGVNGPWAALEHFLGF